jgi:hypothetical protein
MSSAEWIGATGVGILLLAFVLHLAGFLGRRSRPYHLLNTVGAGLACYASHLIGFWPFVVLEGTWAVAALVALVSTRPGLEPQG